MDETKLIKSIYKILGQYLDERITRLLFAIIAKQIGSGGITLVNKVTKISRSRISRGIKELKGLNTPDRDKEKRIRKPGAGRKTKTEEYPQLKDATIKLIDPYTLGDPESTLRYSAKSLRKIAEGLAKQGIDVSYSTVRVLLKDLEYSLQGNKKTLEGNQHPDRNAQFEYISKKIDEFVSSGEPCISVDTKKKELVGDYKNGGKEYAPKEQPIKVNVHDFPKGIPKAAPYGVYYIANNKGWVSVGISKDTAQFAVETIRRSWENYGKLSFPQATKLLILCDGGGSNGYRLRLFKRELQNLANETGLTISVCHYPPRTSKWNKIEHKMFAFISINWRGKPLKDFATIVSLIGSTKTKDGLAVSCDLNETTYETGIKISDSEMKKIEIRRDNWHGEWNYEIFPQNLE